LALALIGLVGSPAVAGTINKDQSTSCKDANSITLEVQKTAPDQGDKYGYTTNDRGTANLVIWKSANFTTVPITLGPNDDNRSLNATDHGLTGLDRFGEMGVSKVVLTKQTEFSRGDSIGDISGVVKITNVSAIPVNVTCN
jgi:hypothetical protein